MTDVPQLSSSSCPVCGRTLASNHGLRIHRRAMNHSPENKCLSCGVELTESNQRRSDRANSQYYCLTCTRLRDRGYSRRYNKSPKSRERGRAYLLRLKLTVMRHYSPSLMCQCGLNRCWHEGPCPISAPRIMCIDHVDGGGGRHRRSLQQAGRKLYNWLKTESFPDGFQVLCHNCNWMKTSVNRELPRKD